MSSMGGVVRIHEDFKGLDFKNTLLHPGFLTDVATALREDEKFDTESVRTSLSSEGQDDRDYISRSQDSSRSCWESPAPKGFEWGWSA